MSKISQEKIERIKEEILRILYENYPGFMYTNDVADAVVRDNEFTLSLLKELKKNNLLMNIEQSKGIKIKRRWTLTKITHEKYKELLS